MGHQTFLEEQAALAKLARELDISKGFDYGLPLATAALSFVPVIGPVLGLFSLFFKSSAEKALEQVLADQKTAPGQWWKQAEQASALGIEITPEYLDRKHGGLAFPRGSVARIQTEQAILATFGSDETRASIARRIAAVPQTVGPLNMPIGFNLDIQTAWPQPGQVGGTPLGLGPGIGAAPTPLTSFVTPTVVTPTPTPTPTPVVVAPPPDPTIPLTPGGYPVSWWTTPAAPTPPPVPTPGTADSYYYSGGGYVPYTFDLLRTDADARNQYLTTLGGTRSQRSQPFYAPKPLYPPQPSWWNRSRWQFIGGRWLKTY